MQNLVTSHFFSLDQPLLLGVTEFWKGSLYLPLILGSHWDPGGSHCILGLIDLGGQWFLGYSDRGSINPRTEWPGGHSIGGSLKPTTPACCHWWCYKLSSCKKSPFKMSLCSTLSNISILITLFVYLQLIPVSQWPVLFFQCIHVYSFIVYLPKHQSRCGIFSLKEEAISLTMLVTLLRSQSKCRHPSPHTSVLYENEIYSANQPKNIGLVHNTFLPPNQ